MFPLHTFYLEYLEKPKYCIHSNVAWNSNLFHTIFSNEKLVSVKLKCLPKTIISKCHLWQPINLECLEWKSHYTEKRKPAKNGITFQMPLWATVVNKTIVMSHNLYSVRLLSFFFQFLSSFSTSILIVNV